MNYKISTVGVCFEDVYSDNPFKSSKEAFGDKIYHFFTFEDGLKVGDYVVCDTAYGYRVGVVSLLGINDSVATKFIVQKIDFSKYGEVLATIEKKKFLEAELEKRMEEYIKRDKYKILADTDEDAKLLLEDLDKIKISF